jgi:hypothetical protein
MEEIPSEYYKLIGERSQHLVDLANNETETTKWQRMIGWPLLHGDHNLHGSSPFEMPPLHEAAAAYDEAQKEEALIELRRLLAPFPNFSNYARVLAKLEPAFDKGSFEDFISTLFPNDHSEVLRYIYDQHKENSAQESILAFGICHPDDYLSAAAIDAIEGLLTAASITGVAFTIVENEND